MNPVELTDAETQAVGGGSEFSDYLEALAEAALEAAKAAAAGAKWLSEQILR